MRAHTHRHTHTHTNTHKQTQTDTPEHNTKNKKTKKTDKTNTPSHTKHVNYRMQSATNQLHPHSGSLHAVPTRSDLKSASTPQGLHAEPTWGDIIL